MTLSGKQVQQIQEALLDAYPSREDLRMMVRVRLEQNLDEITCSDNLRVIIFSLVSWSEKTGRELELIEGAYQGNSTNPKLTELLQEARKWQITPVPKPHTPVAGRIDVFLSFAHADSDVVHHLQEDLRRAGLAVWVDDELKPGTPLWQETIEAAIGQSACMVVALTPASKSSMWVNNEIAVGARLHKPIIPVLTGGDDSTAVPIALASTQYVDIRRHRVDAVNQKLIPVILSYVSPPPPIPSNEKSPQYLRVLLSLALAALVGYAAFWIAYLLVDQVYCLVYPISCLDPANDALHQYAHQIQNLGFVVGGVAAAAAGLAVFFISKRFWSGDH